MDNSKIKIFAGANIPRLEYIAGILLGDILGLQWEIVTDKRKIGKHRVINYSVENIRGALKITPDPLLFETGISKKEITVTHWKNLPVFFRTDPADDFPFDIFASSFYLVSRYEEYLDYTPDKHGRFSASSSLSFRNGFLNLPVVDKWAKEFARTLLSKFPTITFKSNEFSSLLTIDSDQPFAYLGKNLFRSVGGLLRDITDRTGHATDRYKVLTKGEKDPYEVYEYIIASIEKHNTDARFFFPTGDISKYDKNPSWKNELYRILIRKISGKYETGLHPSYYSAEKYDLIVTELQRLRKITGKNIKSGRFHFLRFFVPASYQFLIRSGITEDYTMGYADEPGFRAGLARPFFFYDLREEKQTSLRIIPLMLMDATLYSYKKLNPSASREITGNIIKETRDVGGLFVSLWHNTSLLDTPEWRGWRELFEEMLQMQAQ
ncbi:MAG: polysaccharide deacetylase family protein [Bacteroidales bacterium]|nr:polysaccharide deacetylase family protein [Bacteroidales bacterium]